MLSLTIDGKPYRVQAGSTILDALKLAEVHVPHLCHDDRLQPQAVCRLCVVEVLGTTRPVPSCLTPVQEGMIVRSSTPELEEKRGTILRLLAGKQPPQAKGQLAEELARYGIEASGSAGPSHEEHPYIRLEPTRCIHCYRCVRICEEVQGQRVWQVVERGGRTRIIPDSLLHTNCVSCGACADTCPSGAISDREERQVTQFTRTTCPYCGVGCEMDVGAQDGRIVEVRPAPDGIANRGHLCAKGRYSFGFVHASDRITTPMIREACAWRNVSWEEAIEAVAAGFTKVLKEHGAEAVGVLGSARATNEENYVAQKLARVVLGTNNVDGCARVCHAPSAAGLRASLGTGAATSSYDDIERAQTLLVIGANTTENHPIVGVRIRRAAEKGANLIVVDPRRIELAASADIHVQLRPGTNIPLLNAMANCICTDGLFDSAFVASRVEGFLEYREFIKGWTPARAAALCGVPENLIAQAARLYAQEKPSICFHGLGVTEHVQGSETVMAIANLALLTGNVGKPGSGVNPLRGQNNVQGAAHMGCEPRNLAGFVPLDEGRARFESTWGARVPTTRGLDLIEMLDKARGGSFKALWVIGWDILGTNPNRNVTEKALASLDFLVVQDLFLNETARELGHVFLPVAASFEKEGTFMSSERRVQRVRRAIPPPQGVKTDWEVLCEVAQTMGHKDGFSFASAEEIWDEVRKMWKPGAGMSYARLERGGLQWPCPDESHPGTPLLHRESFAGKPRAFLRQTEFRPTTETCDQDYPFTLITGRSLHQFNAATMTGRTRHNILRPRDVLDISPEDAGALRLDDGQNVVVRSRYGEVTLPLHIDSRIRAGMLFATFQTPAAQVNRVTGPFRDAITHTPEYKVTAVRIIREPFWE